MDPKIIKRGLLFKKGHVVKNWKQRIFVLQEGCEYMYYYKDEKEESLRKPSGQIPLFEAKLSKNVTTTEKRSNLIEISTITERSWLLSADNETEKESWLEALKIAIEKCPFSLDSVYYDSESRNREINKLLKESRRDIEREIKLLLLGPGDAGKSTFVKQMKLLHLNGYSKEELMESRPLIYHNLLFCLKALIYGCQKLNITISSQAIADEINELNKLTEDIIVNKLKDIKTLWEDSGIQDAFAKQNDYQLPASCSYWMSNLDRIGSAGYVPTQADILRTRVVTTGIVETVFTVENVPFRLVDVGGQRAERKKWIHCFQDVTAVIFLIAINEYDLKLVEDESVNRMHESIQLWSDICKEKWLKHIPIIVFLNKSDLFKEKIAKLDMACCFPEYTGGCNYDNGIKFLEDKIVKANPHLDRPIYTYVTCATDTENIKVIFATVKSIVLQQILDDNDF